MKGGARSQIQNSEARSQEPGARSQEPGFGSQEPGATRGREDSRRNLRFGRGRAVAEKPMSQRQNFLSGNSNRWVCTDHSVHTRKHRESFVKSIREVLPLRAIRI